MTPAFLRDTATFGEASGFHSLWGNDHLVMTDAVAPGEMPRHYETLTTFAALAAITRRIRFLTGVIVPSLRDPVLLAKQVATVDRLSGGRLTLGLGVGSSREEFEALAKNAKADRSKMLEEFIRALRQLFETQRGPFDGRYYRFGELAMGPPPLQAPFPIYLTAQIPEGIVRVGALAQGWIVSSATIEHVRDGLDTLRSAATAAGRDPEGIEVCLFHQVGIGRTEDEARAAFEGARRPARHDRPAAGGAPSRAPRRVNLIGTPAQIRERLSEYRAAGVQHVGLVFRAQSADEFFERVTLFTHEVMPEFA